MLIFVTTRAHAYTVKSLLESAPDKFSDRVITLSYGELLSWKRLPAGHYIFADLDRLDALTAAAVAVRIDALQRWLPGAVLLNHPARVLGRLALLQKLHALQCNDFGARRADQPMEGLRFPVFLRPEVDHSGPLTVLLEDAAALDAALLDLPRRGHAAADCLVTEFVDVRNAAGYYEKYSVLRVGESYVATTVAAHDQWVCKGNTDEREPEGWADKDAQFQRDNPHRDEIQAVFELAGIEYGRIDYAFSKGRLQVFEINTNPYLTPAEGCLSEYRASYQRHQAQLLAALLPLVERPLPRFPHYWVTLPGPVGDDVVDASNGLRRGLRSLLRRGSLLHKEHRISYWRNRLRRSA